VCESLPRLAELIITHFENAPPRSCHHLQEASADSILRELMKVSSSKRVLRARCCRAHWRTRRSRGAWFDTTPTVSSFLTDWHGMARNGTEWHGTRRNLCELWTGPGKFVESVELVSSCPPDSGTTGGNPGIYENCEIQPRRPSGASVAFCGDFCSRTSERLALPQAICKSADSTN
jgi:hypothetical protein